MSKFGWAIGKDLDIDSDMANKLDKAADVLDTVLTRRQAQIEQWGDETAKSQLELLSVNAEYLGRVATLINIIEKEVKLDTIPASFVTHIIQLRSNLVELAASAVLQIEALDKIT